MFDFDLKISGGMLIDGTGSPRRQADVGVKDGRVVAIGDGLGTARQTLDAQGLVVAPGFVDIHTHYDAQVLWDSELTVSPWHGVTTAVLGNCGFGVAPTRPEHRDLILRTLERVEGMSLSALEEGLGSPWPFQTFTQYMDLLERTPLGINVAVMVGHTPVRLWVMGDEATTRAATAAEVAQMRALVREAMEVGAVGFATSVSKVHVGYSGRPVPSRLADFEEMLELARAVGESGHGLIHYNVGREPLWQAYEQLHAVSGRPVVWTSLLAGSLGPGSHRAQLEQAAQQRLRGLPIHGQGACRPIQFEFDFRSPVVFDTWASFESVRLADNEAQRRAVYSDPDFRARLKRQVAGRGPDDAWFAGKEAEGDTRRASFREMVVSGAEDSSLLERKLVDLAQERQVDPVDLMLDLALASNLQMRWRIALLNFDESEVSEILADPHVVLGLGDGGAHMSQLCDACHPTYLLGHWVRERGALSLEEAVRRLTSHPADVFGLHDRGRVALGLPADLVVFDPDRVDAGPLERVYDLPAGQDRLISRAIGIEAVFVNGQRLGSQPQAAGRLLRQRSNASD
ncbi:amidohydrolase family protein [Limnohabitans sp.]|uniref:N-acyl-D-amino-acid deacylase family protein n=1 Tax=Limnohabitans sp. TaxID=1907725 RepID=UPI0025BDC53D|nr:amidohydrolase family protein [Limnohabitans sp.]